MNGALLQPISVEQIQGPIHWMGATSFESRCTNSVGALTSAGFDLPIMRVLSYETSFSPKIRGRMLRDSNTQKLEQFAEVQRSALMMVRLHPYRLVDIRSAIDRCARQVRKAAGTGSLVLDCSCITKIHAVGIAEWIQAKYDGTISVYLAYTPPADYNWRLGNSVFRGGYSELVYTPVGPYVDPPDENARSSVDAIILFGHEGGRARYSSLGLDIDRGLGLFSTSENDADSLVAHLENARFVEDTLELQRLDREWRFRDIPATDLNGLRRELSSFASLSESDRLVILPFGPKILAVELLLGCFRLRPIRDIWVSYAVPNRYPSDYSEGALDTSFYSAKLA